MSLDNTYTKLKSTKSISLTKQVTQRNCRKQRQDLLKAFQMADFVNSNIVND